MRGVKTLRQGWRDPFYKPKAKPVYVIPTPEEAEERRVTNEALMQRIFAEAESNAADRRQRANENNATRKLKDMEARTAVEGNTDLNQDNVEDSDV